MSDVVGSHSIVSRKTLQIVVLASLVAFALAYPVVESLDHWDVPTPASDSELQAVVVLTFAGAIVLVTQKFAVLALTSATQPRASSCFNPLWKYAVLFSPDFTASPPLTLRV